MAGGGPILYGDPVERGHPLNRGLAACYRPLPGRGGGCLPDLTGRPPATFVGGPALSAGRPGDTAAVLFDGSATQYTVTHNLGTRDVVVMVRRNSGNYDQVFCDVDVLTTNTVRLTFNTAPTTNLFRCVVIG